MDEALSKSFDESIAELEKAMGKDKGKTPPASEQDFGYNPEDGGGEHKEPDGDEGGEDTDKDGDGAAEGGEAGKGGKMQKSIYETVEATEKDYLDVAPFLRTLTKSISDAVDAIRDEIRTEIGGVKKMQKSMGRLAVAQASMMKSLGNVAQPRQSTLQKSERTFTGSQGQQVTMTRNEIMQKSIDAVGMGKLEPWQVAKIEDRLNRNQEIPADLLRIING